MKKAKKTSWISWYIFNPIDNLITMLLNSLQYLYTEYIREYFVELLDLWLCSYCNKFHSQRIYAFKLRAGCSTAHEALYAEVCISPDSHSTSVCCSKGLEAIKAHTWTPPSFELTWQNFLSCYTNAITGTQHKNYQCMSDLGYEDFCPKEVCSTDD